MAIIELGSKPNLNAASAPPPAERPAQAIDAPIEVSDRAVVTMDTVMTIKNFPSTRSVSETGLDRIVSSVPRSFSPAVVSITGYIAPENEKIITMYKIHPPIAAALTFDGGAMLLAVTVKGSSRFVGK